MHQEEYSELRVREKEKRQEIERAVFEALEKMGLPTDSASRVLSNMEDNCCFEITPPLEKLKTIQYLDIKHDPLNGYKGNSYKPGNIIFNIKKSFFESSTTIFGSADTIIQSLQDGAISKNEILAFIAALLRVAGLSKSSLSIPAATILVAAWESKGIASMDLGELFTVTNSKLALDGNEQLTWDDYNDIINEMLEMKCIEIIEGKLQIMERIVIRY